MSIARQFDFIPVEEYLASELDSPIKHEYLGGAVYAMSGATNAHNRVATNLTSALWARLSGPCEAFNSDTKIRIRLPGNTRFYYPDASVVCRSNPPNAAFQDAPTVVAEVLSDSTRRLDFGEKKEAYLTIPSLEVYLLVEPERLKVIAYRRTEQGFVKEEWEGLAAVLPLPEISVELPLGEIYKNVSITEDT
ncbi:MAG: Uma2 family endonuclease [Vulcanimicrobiota bacterium]